MRKINKNLEQKNISYTTHEMASICFVTVTTVIQWLKDNNLDEKIIRTPGGHRRIPQGIIEMFLNSYNTKKENKNILNEENPKQEIQDNINTENEIKKEEKDDKDILSMNPLNDNKDKTEEKNTPKITKNISNKKIIKKKTKK